jgi:hypothetical protein
VSAPLQDGWITPLRWVDPLELVRITGDYGAAGDCASRTVAASPSGLSRLRRLRGVASTIAGALLIVALLFLFVFGLPGLFAGV